MQHICSVNEVDGVEIRRRKVFMKGVRILAGTRGVLSSKARTDCGTQPSFSSMGTGCSFSASCYRISLTCFYLARSTRGSNLGWGRGFFSSAVRLDQLRDPPSPIFNGYRVFCLCFLLLHLINTCFHLARSARGSNLGWGRGFFSSAVRLDRL